MDHHNRNAGLYHCTTAGQICSGLHVAQRARRKRVRARTRYNLFGRHGPGESSSSSSDPSRPRTPEPGPRPPATSIRVLPLSDAGHPAERACGTGPTRRMVLRNWAGRKSTASEMTRLWRSGGLRPPRDCWRLPRFRRRRTRGTITESGRWNWADAIGCRREDALPTLTRGSTPTRPRQYPRMAPARGTVVGTGPAAGRRPVGRRASGDQAHYARPESGLVCRAGSEPTTGEETSFLRSHCARPRANLRTRNRGWEP